MTGPMPVEQPGAADFLANRDPQLARLIRTLPPPAALPAQEPYPALLQSIVHQQLSMKAAATIWGRFLALFDEGGPAPGQLLALSDEALRSAGLSRPKVAYVRAVAEYATAGGLSAQQLAGQDDEAVIAELIRIKGVGRWTAEMLLIFSLGRADVFAVDDLAIQQSMQQLYRLTVSNAALKREMRTLAEAWAPQRTLACRYLWLWKGSGGV